MEKLPVELIQAVGENLDPYSRSILSWTSKRLRRMLGPVPGLDWMSWKAYVCRIYNHDGAYWPDPCLDCFQYVPYFQ